MRTTTTWLLACLLSVAGCTGRIADPPSGALYTGPTTTDTPSTTVDRTCVGSTPARVWRLSHAQYNASVRDVLGTTLTPADGFEPEVSGTGFRNGADAGFVSTTLVEQYLDSAERLATEALGHLDTLLPCTPADAGNRACVADFIDTFGLRLFRKPVTAPQRERYLALYDGALATSAEEALTTVLTAMLSSPHFLYRFELGADPGSARTPLTPFELVTALSYVILDTTPDDELLAKAADATIHDGDVLRSEIERLLRDPRAKHVFWDFADQYFGLFEVPTLDKDTTMFPEFTPELATSLHDEARAFVNDVVWDGDGRLATLLTADYTFLNERLARLYGVSGVSGIELRRVALDPTIRSGLVTNAGFLATLGSNDSSSPTLRGRFVRTKMLCQQIPDPPPDVADAIEHIGPTNTTRERYEVHTERAECAVCHRLMDPIGFGLESYDAIGRYRTTENGVTVDASGEIVDSPDADGAFEGGRELGERLASNRAVSDCVTYHFFRFVLGRLERPTDDCEIQRLQTRFAESDGQLMELFMAVLDGSTFQYRSAE